MTVAYDPMNKESVTVSYPGIESFIAKPVRIGEFCDKTPEIPLSMLPEEPECSRFLKGLEKRRQETRSQQANAISFGKYRKNGEHNV